MSKESKLGTIVYLVGSLLAIVNSSFSLTRLVIPIEKNMSAFSCMVAAADGSCLQSWDLPSVMRITERGTLGRLPRDSWRQLEAAKLMAWAVLVPRPLYWIAASFSEKSVLLAASLKSILLKVFLLYVITPTRTRSCPTLSGSTIRSTKFFIFSKLAALTEEEESRMKKRSRSWFSHGLLSGQEQEYDPLVLVQKWEHPPLLLAHSSISPHAPTSPSQ